MTDSRSERPPCGSNRPDRRKDVSAMTSTWDWRPLAVVAATDLILVATVGSPWVVDWVTTTKPEGVGKDLVGDFLIEGWGNPDTYSPVGWEHWQAGAVCRVVAFLLLHPWVVTLFARPGGSPRSWLGARLGVWACGPAVGALSGLCTAIPGAFDLSVTAEGRANLRHVAVSSLIDGAYWGLAAGGICWIMLAASSRIFLRRRDIPDGGAGDDHEPAAAVLRSRKAPLVPASGLLVAVGVVAVLGGPTVVEASLSPQVSSSGNEALALFARSLSYIHWWIIDPSDLSELYEYASVFALIAYLSVLALALVIDTNTLATSPGTRAFTTTWSTIIWAAIVGALLTALGDAARSSMVTPVPPVAQRLLGIFRDLVAYELSSELHFAATYAALLGWAPALAVALTAHLLRRDPARLW